MTALLVLAVVLLLAAGVLAGLAMRRENPDNPVLIPHPFGKR